MQFAPEHVIAAIESLGGSVTLAYYDFHSLIALRNPKKFFEKGKFMTLFITEIKDKSVH